MSEATVPVFIVGSGRSGTRTLFRMLAGSVGLEIHHEYLCNLVQPLAARYYMGLSSSAKVKEEIQKWHGAAIRYSREPVWADSSNKLTWIIEPLSELFPTARFLAVVRDGRKVASSFFYKLREEVYDDRSVEVLESWLNDPCANPAPPPEKCYWWNIPREGQFMAAEFPSFDRLQRLAWHWTENTREILDSFASLPAERTKLVRLEDLTKHEGTLRETVNFVGIDYDPIYGEYIGTPRNVFVPLDFQLTRAQEAKFNEIAAPMMERLGYHEREKYRVQY